MAKSSLPITAQFLTKSNFSDTVEKFWNLSNDKVLVIRLFNKMLEKQDFAGN